MEMKKILIVDDDPDFSEAVKAILESNGYLVISACNKQEGLEKIKNEKPDLAILDVMMDTTHDGFELSREIRQDPDLENTAILMLTSIDELTGVNFKAAMSNKDWLPADAYLDKPIEPEQLLSEIDALLSHE